MDPITFQRLPSTMRQRLLVALVLLASSVRCLYIPRVVGRVRGDPGVQGPAPPRELLPEAGLPQAAPKPLPNARSQAASWTSWTPSEGGERAPAAIAPAWDENFAIWAKAWGALQRAQLSRPHAVAQLAADAAAGQQRDAAAPPLHQSALEVLRGSVASAAPFDWYLCLFALAALLALDVSVLQQLPEIERTHTSLLCFWLGVSGVFAGWVWLGMGPEVVADWVGGFLLEIVYCLKDIFVFYLIFASLEVPRRLTSKALFVGLVGSIFYRLFFFMGLAWPLDKLCVIPYVLGVWLAYCGLRQILASDVGLDVTQTAPVRLGKRLLGVRLGEFYDEEGEAILLLTGKHACVTLLGITIACLLVYNFFSGLDVAVAKMSEVSNAYINFSSSAMAMFVVRALFLVMRDILARFSLLRYGTGLILFFAGAEMLVARFRYVNALLSFFVIATILFASAVLSSVKDSCTKPAVVARR